MKVATCAAVVACLAASAAFAQTNGPSPASPAISTPAPATTLGSTGISSPGVLTTAPIPAGSASAPAPVNTSSEPSRSADAPVSGANSFTEGQARARLEGHGYTNLADLKKDDHGVWRGAAMKDGRQVTVALDYQGNVVSQ